MLESLPFPFGLVRTGVAPDHPEVKNVTNDFQSLLDDSRVQWCGNLTVGRDVHLKQLRAHCDAIVLAYGCQSERELLLPGSEAMHAASSHNHASASILSARAFVNMYNGHPAFRHLLQPVTQRLASARSVCIVGAGNVAIDVARMLCCDPESLASTDMLPEAVNALRHSTVRDVHILARRGPLQAAFTIAELRELADSEAMRGRVRLVFDPRDLHQALADEGAQQMLALPANRAIRRKFELMQQLASNATATSRTASDASTRDERRLHFHFYSQPVACEPLATDPTQLQALTVARTRLINTTSATANDKSTATSTTRAEQTDETFTIPCELLLQSVGYRSLPIDGAPYDAKRGVIPSLSGRVVDETMQKMLPATYVAGWLKRGSVTGEVISFEFCCLILIQRWLTFALQFHFSFIHFI